MTSLIHDVFTIASYNIKSGGFNNYHSKSKYPENINLVKKAVEEISADFISLIDTSKWDKIYSVDELRNLFGYKEAFCINVDDTSLCVPVGITVLSNLSILKFEKVRIHDRNGVKTTIKINDNLLEIFSVYLDHRGEKNRVEEIKSLIKQVRNNNTILMGDFNSLKPADVDYSKKLFNRILKFIFLANFNKDFRELIRTVEDMLSNYEVYNLVKENGFLECGDENDFQPTMPTKFYFPLIPPIFRVDYIFYTPDISVKNFQIIKGKLFDKASDHYPISCEINF